MPKFRKKTGKIRKNWKKELKSGRKGKNREGSFTLSLMTDVAGYATELVYLIGVLTGPTASEL